MTYVIHEAAVLKILLHATKYPAFAIDGFLIGKVQDSGAVQISDAVPLFHGTLHLAMPLETALIQVPSALT